MFLLLTLLATAALATTVRRGEPHEWSQLDTEVPRDQMIRFRIALPQRNLDVLEREVLERSSPSSPKYAQWFTQEQVLDMVAPADESIAVVAQWAEDNDLQVDASRRDIIICIGTVAQVEAALKTKLSHWQHANGDTHLRTLEYTLPSEVAAEVESVVGLSEFWTRPKGPRRIAIAESRKRNNVKAGYVIPDTCRRLYNLPKDSFRDVSKYSSVGVAEFQDNARFSHRDLRYFDREVGEHHSHVDHIVGPWTGSLPNGESQLDIEYASTLALNSSYWYWTATEWMLEFANDLFAAKARPDVISMSWGWPEPKQCQIANCHGLTSSSYVARVDAEWLKITSTGVTLTASSGDQGAPGDTHAGACDGMSDIFPGASKWVLSVGATMLSTTAPKPSPPPNQPPVCSNFDCSTVTEEVACSFPDALITTGGGFAAYSKQLSHQAKAVNAYLKSGVTLPPASSFNTKNRAFPDISAMGHAVLIGINQQMEQVDGTSCSSPMVAAMIALLNGWRLNNGKKTLGYINTMIYEAFYQDPTIFNDITKGANKCSEGCCSQKWGYEATKGWDPVTGVGTPNFEKLLAYVKTLK